MSGSVHSVGSLRMCRLTHLVSLDDLDEMVRLSCLEGWHAHCGEGGRVPLDTRFFKKAPGLRLITRVNRPPPLFHLSSKRCRACPGVVEQRLSLRDIGLCTRSLTNRGESPRGGITRLGFGGPLSTPVPQAGTLY